MKKCKFCRKQPVQLIADKDVKPEWVDWMTGRQIQGEDEITMEKRLPIIQTNLCLYHNKALVGFFGIALQNEVKRKVIFHV